MHFDAYISTWYGRDTDAIVSVAAVALFDVVEGHVRLTGLHFGLPQIGFCLMVGQEGES